VEWVRNSICGKGERKAGNDAEFEIAHPASPITEPRPLRVEVGLDFNSKMEQTEPPGGQEKISVRFSGRHDRLGRAAKYHCRLQLFIR